MNLFNSPILDIALTLVFIYFILGLIVSSLNEIAMSMLKKRQQFLKEAIHELLFDQEWKHISTKIIDSPFIKSLKKKSDHFPAYIPARSFALAMLDVLRDGKDVQLLSTQKIREQLTADSSPIKGDAKKMLLGILDQADNDLSKFQAGVERMYDDAMDRANGWYKKHVRVWIFCISITLCIVLNVDSILITQRLWQDPAAAKQAASLVETNLKNISTDSTKSFAVYKTDGGTKTVRMASINEGNVEDAMKNNNKSLKASVKSTEDLTALITELPIPVGWAKDNRPTGCFDFATKLLGWLLTSFALMLGAPFWFDLLNKIVNLRAVGKKPEKSDEGVSLTNK